MHHTGCAARIGEPRALVASRSRMDTDAAPPTHSPPPQPARLHTHHAHRRDLCQPAATSKPHTCNRSYLMTSSGAGGVVSEQRRQLSSAASSTRKRWFHDFTTSLRLNTSPCLITWRGVEDACTSTQCAQVDAFRGHKYALALPQPGSAIRSAPGITIRSKSVPGYAWALHGAHYRVGLYRGPNAEPTGPLQNKHLLR